MTKLSTTKRYPNDTAEIPGASASRDEAVGDEAGEVKRLASDDKGQRAMNQQGGEIPNGTLVGMEMPQQRVRRDCL